MKLRILLAGLLAIPVAALAQGAAKPGGKDAVATVNGVAVPKARMDFMMQQHLAQGAQDNDQTRQAVREDLIDRELVSQEATRTGLAKSPEVQMQMDMARQGVLINAFIGDYVKKHPVTDEDVQKEYDRAKTQSGDKEYKARHILVETEDQAKGLIADLKKGAKFEDLAAKNSKDPGTKDRGGDLDWNVPGVFDKAFSDAMVKLEKGKYTDKPVQTRYGYHVIQLDDVRDARFPALAEIKPRIQQQLMQHKIEGLVRDLRSKAKVEAAEK
jgi:peptidyl-prolyl cis-trans isomerase C